MTEPINIEETVQAAVKALSNAEREIGDYKVELYCWQATSPRFTEAQPSALIAVEAHNKAEQAIQHVADVARVAALRDVLAAPRAGYVLAHTERLLAEAEEAVRHGNQV